MASFETNQGRNRRRAYVLLASLFVLLATVSLGLGWYLGATSVSLVAFVAVFSTLATWISWWKADAIVLRITRATIVDADQAPQLHNLIEELCIASGLAKPRIAIVDDAAPNAFATGRDPEHAVVAFTSGLLERMDRDELQGVAAHELAHIANRDTLVMTLAATTAGIIALIADLALRLSFGMGRGRSDRKGSNSAPIALVVLLVASVLAPLAAALLKGALSRSREHLADATAVEFTRNPAGLRRALEKLASDSTVVQARSSATAHLWIESPLDEKRRINRWFSTHPPIGDRIDALRVLEGNPGWSPPSV
jgi:heat shock protein HtpX